MQRIQNNDLGYLGNPSVKRDGIQQGFSPEEVIEYQRCMVDPAYFVEKYMKIINLDHGLIPFTPYTYQKNMFDHFNSNRFSIVLACRQSGKSISSVGYILWYALFHADKTIAILANKGATAREMLSRVTLALENVPFFLQPGCKTLNKGTIQFSNNTKIIASATSGSSIRGMSCNMLFLDEFAFVERAEEFYTSTYPVISSGKQSKVIITSTANGVGNMFYKLWEGAVQGTNEFKPFRVDWWDVPGRDEAWKKQTIGNTSELQFEQEYGNSFHGTTDTLISSGKLLGLKAQAPIKQTTDGLSYYAAPVKDAKYIMTVDVSKGRGQDYSTFNVIDISSRPFKQVATYRNNNVSPLLFPDIIVSIAKRYNNALVLIENNDAGQVVCNCVYYEYEYENTFVESAVKAGGIGVTMTKRVKRIGCSNLKDLLEYGKLLIYDANTIQELSTFVSNGNSYEARDGTHDDLVMNLVLFSWFVSQEAFGEHLDNAVSFKELIFGSGNLSNLEAIEADLTPPGIFDSANSSVLNQEYIDMIESQKAFNEL